MGGDRLARPAAVFRAAHGRTARRAASAQAARWSTNSACQSRRAARRRAAAAVAATRRFRRTTVSASRTAPRRAAGGRRPVRPPASSFRWRFSAGHRSQARPLNRSCRLSRVGTQRGRRDEGLIGAAGRQCSTGATKRSGPAASRGAIGRAPTPSSFSAVRDRARRRQHERPAARQGRACGASHGSDQSISARPSTARTACAALSALVGSQVLDLVRRLLGRQHEQRRIFAEQLGRWCALGSSPAASSRSLAWFSCIRTPSCSSGNAASMRSTSAGLAAGSAHRRGARWCSVPRLPRHAHGAGCSDAPCRRCLGRCAAPAAAAAAWCGSLARSLARRWCCSATAVVRDLRCDRSMKSS